MNLEPIDPETVIELYLEERDAEASPTTIRSHGARLPVLNSDMPKTAVGDRANLSHRVLEIHSDQWTKKEKMEQRRAYLGNI